MWRNRHKADNLATRQHHGTAHAECVCRASGGSIYDESVGLVGREILAVNVNADAYHTAAIVLEHSHFVQGKGIALHLSFGAFHLQHPGFLCAQQSCLKVCECLLDVAQREVRQEAQPPGIDAEDGNLLCSDSHGSGKESAVAAHADREVRFEVIAGDEFVFGDADVHLLLEINVERLVDEWNNAKVGQRVEECLHCFALLGLVRVPKDCTSFCLFHKLCSFWQAKV